MKVHSRAEESLSPVAFGAWRSQKCMKSGEARIADEVLADLDSLSLSCSSELHCRRTIHLDRPTSDA